MIAAFSLLGCLIPYYEELQEMYAFENHYFVQFTCPSDFIAFGFVLIGSAVLGLSYALSIRFELFENAALKGLFFVD